MKNNTKNSIVLLPIIFMRPIGFILYLASFSALTLYFSTSSKNIVMTLTWFYISIAIGEFFWGTLSEKIGRKKIILFALFAFAVANYFCIYATTINSFMIFRLVQGFICGFNISVLTAVFRDMYDDENILGRWISLTEILFGVAIIAYGTLGAILFSCFGWKGVFIFISIYSLSSAILIILFFTETKSTKTIKEKDVIKIYQKMVINYKYVVILLLAVIAASVTGVQFATTPFLTVDYMHASPIILGIVLSIAGACYMLGSAFNLLILRKRTIESAIKYGIIIFVAGGISMFSFGIFGIFNVYTFLVPLGAVMLGAGSLYPLLVTELINIYPKHRGQVGASVGFVTYMGGALVTYLISCFNISNLYSFSLIFNAMAITFLLLYVVLCITRNKFIYQS